MRNRIPIVAALLVFIAAAAQAQASLDPLKWLSRELSGRWATSQTGQGASKVASPAETSFTYQGGGVFRVHSAESSAPLGQWNGRQVRVTGQMTTDDKGWTYFQLNGQPARIGRHRDGRKIVEINYEDRTRFVELVQST